MATARTIRTRDATARWYAAHSEYKKQYAKNWRSSLRLEVLTHYSQGIPRCTCCNEATIEFLSIDHIDGGGTQDRLKNRREGTSFYTWLRKAGYPDGFQVLCHNCNFAKGAYGECPHRRAS